MFSSRLDFTYQKYSDLCQSALKSGFTVLTVSSYIKNVDDKRVLVIRHDVDNFPRRALRLAKLEHSLGIHSTYYFRKHLFSNPKIIKSVAEMGHEIGYHYESLDEAKGNYEAAIDLFRLGLEQLRQIAKVETICMHGNSFTKWLNRDLWNKYDFHQFDLVGEAYLSVKNIYYFSDTGHSWDTSRKFKDLLPSALPEQVQNVRAIVTTNNLIEFIESGEQPRIYLTAHPERWGHNLLEWLIDEMKDQTINMAKAVLRKIKFRFS